MRANLRFVLSIVLSLFLMGSLVAQSSWEDYIHEDRGDTVVIIPTSTTGYLNTVFHAIMGDTTGTGERTNPNRVYETLPGGVYIYDGTALFDVTVPNLRIVGPEITNDVVPPLHIRTTEPDGGFDKTMFSTNGSLYMENQYLCNALTNNTLDREVLRAYQEGGRYEFDNCIIEFTNWTCFFPSALGQTFIFTNNLMHNIGAEPTLEKGAFFDSWKVADTVWFENNTILNHGILSLSRPNLAPSFAYYNHNTIVNGVQNPFLFFSQPEMVATNNLIINTGIAPDYPDFYPFFQDEDKLPKGIINADTVETAWIDDHWSGVYPVASDADRKILVDKNNAWWDTRFAEMFENDLPAFPDTIDEEWASQMITMNSRTQDMFDDDASYPYFVEGTWYNAEPDFANNKDNVQEWINFIITNSTPGDPNGGNAVPRWRTHDTTDLVQIDWPPLADLSYTQSELKTGGVNRYPLGDLNWFPSLKSRWEGSGETAKLIEAMKKGELLQDWAAVGIDKDRVEKLSSSIQTFPNPFSDHTTVRFDIRGSSNVEMIVYNILGEKVRVLELGQRSAGVHEVTLNKGNLNSGMYILQLNTDDNNAGLISKISIK